MQDLGNVTAAILAGGRGTRLRGVVRDSPKVLANIQGRPFLAYVLDQIVAAGVRQVVLCTGHLGDQVQAAFGDSFRNLRFTYSRESSPLGTAGALRLALPLLKSDLALVLNGDSFCHTDLRAFWAWHSARKTSASILLIESRDTARYGRVEVDGDSHVKSFVEKGKANGPGWINAGIYLLSRDFLQAIPADRPVSIEKEVFPAWIGRGLSGYRTRGRFLDIGTPPTYAAAERFFEEGKSL